MAVLLEVEDLRVSFQGDRASLAILNGVSLAVEAGETIGLVGESGSGKTVLVRAILGLLEAPFSIDSGSIRFEGKELLGLSERELGKIRGREIALTTPEPRKHLNPLITIGRQMANVIQAHAKVSRRQAIDRSVELLRSVGIPDPTLRIASYPHELSGGMCQRVIIAIALAHDSKILLVDEPTAGLDVTISRQILDLIGDLARERQVAALLVSRDLGVVAHYCGQVAVMYAGRIVEQASVSSFFRQPIHPYSNQLLRAAASARDRSHADTRATALLPPAAHGCAYAGRCALAQPACRETAPALEVQDAGHLVRCLRRQELARGEVAA